MNIYVFDIETDGLDATRIHCLSYCNLTTGVSDSLVDLDGIRHFIRHADVLIGHNITRFDIPTLERLCGIDVHAKLVDTLALSWYLEPERQLHGLESWGETFGVPKPIVTDWSNQPLDVYIHRCEEDVRINTKLWKRQKSQLIKLYGGWDKAKKLIDYLSFKMDCAREQERSKWLLDVAYAQQSILSLVQTKEEKLATLLAAMPKTPVYAQRMPPAKPFKKDGTLSVSGATWRALLRKEGLPENHKEPIKEVVRYVEPKPTSPVQVKDWLYSLGWKPITFKFVRDKETGDVREIPQINLEHGGGLCPSVLRLADKHHSVSVLADLGVVSHRIGLLRGFIDSCSPEGYIKAEIQGLTNTLRFKHKTVVNLPKVGKPYGEEIRGCLIAPDGWELCGADMVSLEDRLKMHYIFPHDPAYVEEMSTPDYDPHLSLALQAKEVTDEQVEAYKSGTSKAIKPIRDIFKNGNYACQYGAGPPRLALTADIPLAKAKVVHRAYWEKNWAIKVVAKEQKVKTVDGQMWLFNPISELWYSLRYEKDIFSTLVQGSASYVFDLWVREFRRVRSQLTAQFHDEVVLCTRKGFREQATKLLTDAIETINQQLQLNRRLDISVQFGNKYSEIH